MAAASAAAAAAAAFCRRWPTTQWPKINPLNCCNNIYAVTNVIKRFVIFVHPKRGWPIKFSLSLSLVLCQFERKSTFDCFSKFELSSNAHFPSLMYYVFTPLFEWYICIYVRLGDTTQKGECKYKQNEIVLRCRLCKWISMYYNRPGLARLADMHAYTSHTRTLIADIANEFGRFLTPSLPFRCQCHAFSYVKIIFSW